MYDLYARPNQIGIWSDFLAELKDAAGAFGTPAYTSMPGQVRIGDDWR